MCSSSTSLTIFFSLLELGPSLCPLPPHLSLSRSRPSSLTYIHRLPRFVLTPSIPPSYLSNCGNFPQLLRSHLIIRSSRFSLFVVICWIIVSGEEQSADVSCFFNGFLEGIKPAAVGDPALFNWLTICPLSAQVCHLFYLWQD